MTSKKTAPYGTWESPITSDLVTGQTITLQAVKANKTSGLIYWLEGRSDGRSYIVERQPNGATRDVLPDNYSARSSVHEYGGANFDLTSIGDIVFVDATSDTLALLKPATGECHVIQQRKGLRYADFDSHPILPDKILAIQEDHTNALSVVNRLVTTDTNTNSVTTFQEGADFYTTPRWSPNGHQACWLQWNFPDMPWTGAELWVADVIDGRTQNVRQLGGRSGRESISQPRWAEDGTLYFTTDRSGFWQFSRLLPGSSQATKLTFLNLEDVNFSHCEWFLGSCSYLPLTPETLVASYTKDAQCTIVILHVPSLTFKSLEIPITCMYIEEPFTALAALSSTSFLAIGRSDTSPWTLYQVSTTSPSHAQPIRSSTSTSDLIPFFSKPTHLSFPRASSSPLRNTKTHGFFYPPHNPNFTAPADTLPPLIVECHGGPTSHSTAGLHLPTQFDTSRGYAVLLINYGGSSGYDKDYRESLNTRWGALDPADAGAAVTALAAQGLIDASRVGIRGGSAGGYLVLRSLVALPHVWAGGVSYYGVGDVARLRATTHKFERRYLDALLFDPEMEGGDGDDEKEKAREARMRERSPVWEASRIRAPVLLLQGDADAVVPREQAETMEKRVREAGGEARLVVFPGEGHGFLRSETLKEAKEEEERWWRKTLVRDG
ncbi:MAG: hypothetical protein M1822_003468 [Bathelium mastoideum]|nr:MAG: hypothetical protein M1822_003468 [Bathelium mastoideum]